MDISAFKTKGTSTLHVLHAVTKEPLFADSDPVTGKRPEQKKGKETEGEPVTITGYGSDSNVYRTSQSDNLRDQHKQMAAQHKANPQRGFVPDPPKAEEVRDAATRTLAVVITEWTGLLDKGKAFAVNTENTEWFMDNADDIREQWDKHIHDRANFLPGA